MEDGSGCTLKDGKTKTELEWCYKKNMKKHKTGERGDWKLDALTPNNEKAEEEQWH